LQSSLIFLSSQEQKIQCIFSHCEDFMQLYITVSFKVSISLTYCVYIIHKQRHKFKHSCNMIVVHNTRTNASHKFKDENRGYFCKYSLKIKCDTIISIYIANNENAKV